MHCTGYNSVMPANPSLYAVMLILASASGMVAVGVALSRWRSHGAGALISLLAGLSFWSLTYSFLWVSQEPEWKYFWLNMTYLGVVTVPASLLIFAYQYAGRDAWITPSRLALFFIEPVAVLILVWTDPRHGWFFAGKRALTDSVLFDGSPLFWIHVLYSYGLLLVATVILFGHALRSVRFYQQQIGWFLASLSLPWVVNILSVARLSPFPDLDLTPIVFTFTAIVILYGMLNQRLLDILPIARDLLVENMDECLLVLDNNQRVVDFNASAQRFFSYSHQLKVGELITPLIRRWHRMVGEYIAVEQLDTEIMLGRDPPAYFDLQIRPVRDRHERLLGRLLIWRDVTARKQVELALQEANQQLQARVEEVESLQAQLREQSIRDALTGVFNRRYLDETLAREFKRAQREKKPLTVAIMDLDSFKSINDTFGHTAGDLALQRISEFLSVHIRASDILCRYGGEEFVIVMPGLDVEAAHSRAENWRESIERLVIESPKGLFHVTASVGVAVCPIHAGDVEGLLRAADDALYAAKRDGKNRVSVSGSSGSI
jgi:diguanylate cyclase (GGDEF)-like protein